jgi:hypothetical protein
MQICEGPNSPGTTANDASIGTEAWGNTDNAKLEDGNSAAAKVATTGAP